MFDLPERFWSKVQRGDGCWTWAGSRDQKGYGLFRYQGRLIRAHRLVLISLGHDMVGRVSRHACDNPPCVRPDHLEPGTVVDNAQDCAKRGRVAVRRGTSNHNAKVTDSDIAAIRAAFAALPKSAKGYCADGAAQAIAKQYGITYRALKFIVNRESWAHV